MTQEEFLNAFDSKKRNFEMFSAVGNKKCQAITKRLIKKIFGSKRVTKEEVQELAGKLIAKAAVNSKTEEILDSEPPYHIKGYVNKALEIAGYGFEFDSYSIIGTAFDEMKKLEKA